MKNDLYHAVANVTGCGWYFLRDRFLIIFFRFISFTLLSASRSASIVIYAKFEKLSKSFQNIFFFVGVRYRIEKLYINI